MNLRRIPADRTASIFGNRLVRTLSLTTAGIALAVAAGAVAHATTGYVVTASPNLSVRSGPGTGYPVVGRVGHGAALDISCQVKSGSFVGGSDVWDRIGSGYVSDYWVSTPAFNAFSSGIARCDNPGGSPARAAVPAQGTVIAGTCSGAGCDGQDPQSTGCAADAINAAVTSEGGVTLQLRYSPSCHANWARMLPGQFLWHFTVYNANGAQHDSTGFRQDSTWTRMVDGNVKAEACFDNGNCTGWV
jgi:hypothetical protein